MAATDDSRKPQLDVAGGAESLPVRYELKGSRSAGVVALVLAGVSALGGALSAALWATGAWDSGVIGLCLAALAAVGLLAAGASELRRYREIVLADGQVRVRRQGLFGSGDWAEHLSGYDGVLVREVYHSGGENSPSYTEYILDLRHADNRRRTVRLYCSRSPDGFRAK